MDQEFCRQEFHTLQNCFQKEKTGFQLFSFQMHELKVDIFNHLQPSQWHPRNPHGFVVAPKACWASTRYWLFHDEVSPPCDCHVQQVAPSLRPSGCPLVRTRSLRCPAGFLFVLWGVPLFIHTYIEHGGPAQTKPSSISWRLVRQRQDWHSFEGCVVQNPCAQDLTQK